jgi:MATE family multidrug resistance protein
LSPIVAHDFGAGRYREIGHDVRQTIWAAIGLSVIGMLLMIFPRPFMQLAHAPESVEILARSYLQQLAWGLPGALLARVFYAFSPAVG